ncbi:hypothetical protein D3981_005489 [Escherichia coli]|nr:hypothetical protein [Escherichia coli]
MDDIISVKRCRKCEQIKPFSEFGIDRKSKDGHKTRCRECVAEENRDYKVNNRLVVNAEKQRYRKRHAAKIAAYMRRYRARIRGAELTIKSQKLNERIALKTGEVSLNQLILNPETLKIEKLLLIYKMTPNSQKGKRAFRDAKALAIKMRMKYDVFAAILGSKIQTVSDDGIKK